MLESAEIFVRGAISELARFGFGIAGGWARRVHGERCRVCLFGLIEPSLRHGVGAIRRQIFHEKQAGENRAHFIGTACSCPGDGVSLLNMGGYAECEVNMSVEILLDGRAVY
jgi:hypothetical protein